MMKCQLFLLFIIVKVHSNEYSNDDVVYFENLINKTQIENSGYQLPINSKYFQENSNPNYINYYGEYDFIIVGAGSAGTVIANKLSENTNWKILLLEAGKNETNFSDIPAMQVSLQFSEMNWGYNTTPQTYSCLGMNRKQCFYPRGKALGGSSTVNSMMYVRGNRKDYDIWEAQGNPGWAYKNVLPYFLNVENSEIAGDPGYHGFGGPLNVAYPQPILPIIKTYIEGQKELGKKEIDYNGRSQIGVGRTQFTVINGRRDSGAKAFLRPVECRKNLQIVTEALVLKILINKSTKIAHGVKFILNGKLYSASVTKEVVVSAGAINSPQLLMLSGIGPRSHLQEREIKILRNLRGVGKNLQDHIFFPIPIETNYTVPIEPLSKYVKEYLKGKGLLSRSLVLASGFINVGGSSYQSYPDIQSGFVPFTDPTILIPINNFNYDNEIIENYLLKLNSQTTLTLIVALLHPKSRGSIKLQSSNPFEYPLIDVNYLSHPYDIEILYRGVLDSLRLLQTNAFKQYNATLVKYVLSACKDHVYLSREYWICNIRQIGTTFYHPVGTCKMGPASDCNAVVDNKLRVHGIKSLRVADCSIMPLIVSGNTNAPTYMIGGKAADLIREDYIK